VSATGRSDVRRADDFYETPAWCVRRLLETGCLPVGRWLEPAVGGGAIVRAANAYDGLSSALRWDCLDLRANRYGDVGDFLVLAESMRRLPRWDVAITNPPYSLAAEFAKSMLALADHVAILTRLNFLAGGARRSFFATCMPDVYVLPNRPSFTEDGRTDATEYAWLVWGPNRGGPVGQIRVLAETPKGER
jgi:hypothetical protein